MISDSEAHAAHSAWLKHGKSRTKAREALGLAPGTFQRRLEAYVERGLGVEKKPQSTLDEVIAGLRKSPKSTKEIAKSAGVTVNTARMAIEAARDSGVNLHDIGGRWSIEKTAPLRPTGVNARYELKSDKANRFVFGFVTDNHIGSKYARLDVLHDMYDRFAARGVTHVFNAGNWIDGEARFNKFDLKIHGMDAQLRYLAEKYPQRKGITTYFVAGDDHEGWYSKSTGVDIGRYAENKMRDAGRSDFVYLGYMEADVALINANTKKQSTMRVVHPGGGSAYAISYAPQKLVESYEGGDKPAVVLIGHWHKMNLMNYRNTWIIQGGTTEDQTPFMRKLKLDAHVGGLVVTLDQDKATGAIVGCNDLYRYFNRGYYPKGDTVDERFSMHGPVKMRERSLGGV